MEKEKAAELFDVSGKNIQHFKTDTREGNKIEGWICKSHGSNMGSMIIESVNGIETLQFVRGMPKIHYLDENTDLSTPTILNKEDGTNVLMYPLMLNGDCLEVCFKTRLMPSLQNKFMKRVNLAITDDYYGMVENNLLSFAFELYGYENSHEVKYRDLEIPIRLDLLTSFDQGKSLPVNVTEEIAAKYNVPLVIRCLEKMRIGNIVFNKDFLNRYGEYMPEEFKRFNTLPELYQSLETFFEKINMNYQEKHQGGIIVEGSVWHYGDEENHMLKNKALSVREGHIKQACGIPTTEIKKAVLKAEENDVDITNDLSVITFVRAELLEENPLEMVMDVRTDNKIMSFVRKYTRKVEITETLREMANKVLEEVGNEVSPADKMRAFSQMFPDKKNLSGKMYQTFVRM